MHPPVYISTLLLANGHPGDHHPIPSIAELELVAASQTRESICLDVRTIEPLFLPFLELLLKHRGKLSITLTLS